MSYDYLVSSQFSWQRGAACKNVPSYVFFPEERSLPDFVEDEHYRGKRAADYCANCPVKQICLEFSVLHDAEGIWGNTDDRWRKRRYSKGERFEMRNDQEEVGQYYPLYGHS